MAIIGEMHYLTIGDKTYTLPSGGGGGSSVLVDTVLTSGTKSATLNVDGVNYDIYSVTNTDTKLQVASVTSGTTYYPLVGTGTTAATRQYDTTGLVYVGTNGTANDTNGNSLLTLGNSTASTTAN